MRTEDEFEELLGNLARPRLVEGPHRAALKAKLLTTCRKESSSMKIRKVIILLSILVAAGAFALATQQTWRNFMVYRSGPHGPVVVQPDGKVGAAGSAVGVLSIDPNFSQAQADQQWAKMKEAIAEGHYRLRTTKETNGVTVFCYDITLADGKVVGFGSSRPIEEIQAELNDSAEGNEKPR